MSQPTLYVAFPASDELRDRIDTFLEVTREEPDSNHVQELEDWEKATLAMLLIALIAELVAFIWAIVVFYSCCCTKCLTPPLPILAFISFLCVLIAWVVYIAKLGDVVSAKKGAD